MVCAPAAERQACQAAATEQAPEQELVAPEQPMPSEPLSARERRQNRTGEALQKLEAEAALQHKATPKTSQPAFPGRQDSFNQLGVANKLIQNANPQEAVSNPRQRTVFSRGYAASLLDPDPSCCGWRFQLRPSEPCCLG